MAEGLNRAKKYFKTMCEGSEHIPSMKPFHFFIHFVLFFVMYAHTAICRLTNINIYHKKDGTGEMK